MKEMLVTGHRGHAVDAGSGARESRYLLAATVQFVTIVTPWVCRAMTTITVITVALRT